MSSYSHIMDDIRTTKRSPYGQRSIAFVRQISESTQSRNKTCPKKSASSEGNSGSGPGTAHDLSSKGVRSRLWILHRSRGASNHQCQLVRDTHGSASPGAGAK